MAETWYSKWYKEKTERQLRLDEIRKYNKSQYPEKEKPKLHIKPLESKEQKTIPFLTKEFEKQVVKEEKIKNILVPKEENTKTRYMQFRQREKEILEKQSHYPDSVPINPAPKINPVILISPKKTEPIKEPKPDPEKVLEELSKKVQPNINKTYILIGTLIIILIIIACIYFFTKPTLEAKLTPLDIVAYNSTGLPMNIYYNNKQLFSLSGWESSLEYKSDSDRLFGNQEYKKLIFDNTGKAYTIISLDDKILIEPLTSNPNKVTKIGWFTDPGQIKITSKKSWGKKTETIELSNSSELNTRIIYTFFSSKPYFKVQFLAQSIDSNDSELGNFSYGLIIKDFDIYLDNSTILENDNKIEKLNTSIELAIKKGENITRNISSEIINSLPKELDTSRQAIKRKGSNYDIRSSDYQIFMNKNKTMAIIVYATDINSFKDYFFWNVYQINVPNLGQGVYPELYFMIIENPELKYNSEENDWIINSNKYSGPVKPYINQVIDSIDKEEE